MGLYTGGRGNNPMRVLAFFGSADGQTKRLDGGAPDAAVTNLRVAAPPVGRRNRSVAPRRSRC